MNIFSSFHSIFKRICNSWVLFSLNHCPAFIVVFFQNVENRFEIDAAVARNSEHTHSYAVEEAHVFVFNFFHEFFANVFQMNVFNTVYIFFKIAIWSSPEHTR